MIYVSLRLGVLYAYPIVASCQVLADSEPPIAPADDAQAHTRAATMTNAAREHWATYWLVLSLLVWLVEWPVDALFSFLPGWKWAKLCFFVWLSLPRFQGAETLYWTCVYPWLQQHEAEIQDVQGKAVAMAKQGSKGLVATLVSRSSSGQGGGGGGGQGVWMVVQMLRTGLATLASALAEGPREGGGGEGANDERGGRRGREADGPRIRVGSSSGE